jgi:hypothetical protein
MMPRFERRIEILRVQIANQRNPPMLQRNTPIEQRERSIRVMPLARTLGKSRGGIARRIHRTDM